ncbi:MAG TPA: LuxR C-terminal-related transcriptional regulator [Gemmatimonadales bacterium]|jgi:DNA-binding NarL/FixJ family response regulator|nr:LuxR C-terminal-related transcriptional regulator [Gemmatimonadales bacterium]
MQRRKRTRRKLDGAAVVGDADRLNELRSTFSTLRQDGQALIQRIRGSLSEMRELRQELSEHRAKPGRSDRLGLSRGAHLERQYKLTAREMDVAMLLAQGRSNDAIAKALRISSHTARHHTQRILIKLNVHSRAEAGAKIRG